MLSAEKTVTYTELKEWIKKGEGMKYRVLRPQKKLQKKISYTIKQALFHKGKIYDFQFTWDNKKIYNSELIQKVFYKGANIYLGEFIRVTGVSVPPEDSVLFNSCKEFIPYNKEIVTVNSIFNSSYLKNDNVEKIVYS